LYIQVKGCNFHQKQAHRINLHEKRLEGLINQSSKFEYLVPVVYGLALVPHIRVGEIFSISYRTM
jgi:hypothetical protein